MISHDLSMYELPCFMLDICELTSFVTRSELMWFYDSIFSEHAFSTTVQMENLGTNVTMCARWLHCSCRVLESVGALETFAGR